MKALIGLVLIFLIINSVIEFINQHTAIIDGQVYNTAQSTLQLTLMTEDGIEELSRFTRLRSLKVTPYKAEILNALRSDDPALISTVRNEMDDVYGNCTDVENVVFLKYFTKLKKLNIAYCRTSDITPVSFMSDLEELNISFTSVSDLDALSDLDSLKKLYIDGIPCKNLSPLLTLDSLEYLYTSADSENEVIKALAEKGVTIEYPDSEKN